MPRIHIRRENVTLQAVAGTEEPRAGDITLTIDDTFDEDTVTNLRNHMSVAARSVPRIHIRRGNGALHAVPGTEEPRAITLTFDHTIAEAMVTNLRNHMSVAATVGLSPIYPENSPYGKRLIIFGLLALGFFIVTAVALYWGHERYPVWSFAAGAAWTIAVPIYFFYEHEFIFFRYGNTSQYDQFKRVQDLAAKIWAGGIAVLGAIVAFKLSH